MSVSFRRLIAVMRSHLIAALVMLVGAGMAGAVRAQPAAAPGLAGSAAPAGTPGEPTSPRPENPGLLNEIGKFWDKSTSMLPSLVEPRAPAAESAAKPLEAPAAPAPPSAPASALVAPAKPVAPPPAAAPSPAPLVPAMISGRMQCPTAGNGAPDCKAAAERMCQSRGYQDGKSLSSDSVEACSAKALIPGRERKPDDCRTNYFVTRAFCQ